MKRARSRLSGYVAMALALALFVGGCARPMPVLAPPAERAAIAAQMMRDITILASDDFGGRKPGTIGEARTLAYLMNRMQEVGLVSGTNDPGSAWRSPVALVSTVPQSSRVAFTINGRVAALAQDSAAAFSPRRRERAEGGPMTGVEVIFAGNDAAALENTDIAGSIIILVGQDEDGEAARSMMFERGAGAVLSVVSSDAALARIRERYSSERVQLAGEQANALVAFAAEPAVAKAMGSARWDELVKQAGARDFKPITLDIGVSIEATAQQREFVSHNLIGVIPGQRPDTGAVLLLAHWDHLGECGPSEADDRMCRGAVDNASGVAMMLELARRLKAGRPLDRDIFVLATTAEESGLLGVRAFVDSPPIPLAEFVAAFNFDTVAVARAGSPVGLVGHGQIPFEPIIIEHLAKAKRTLSNRDFASTFLQRQDGWVLLKEGVPTVLLSSAFATRDVLGPFLARKYHSPADRPEPIELGGAIDDLLLHEQVIKQVADPARYQAPAPAPADMADPAP